MADLPIPWQVASTAVDMVGTSVTAAAVLIGGSWAYFKFVKGRTFRPRLDVQITGSWVEVEQRPHLLASITIKNLGSSDIKIIQDGSALRASVLDPLEPGKKKRTWSRFAQIGVFKEHEWIEPSEALADEVLIDLFTDRPMPCELATRLVSQYSRKEQITTFARKIIIPDQEPEKKSNPTGGGMTHGYRVG